MFARKKKKEDLYIRVLKYCRERLEDKVRPFDIIEYLNKTHGYTYREVQDHPELIKILTFAFDVRSISNMNFYPLTGEAYFKLLEYEELSLARKNASEARWLSIVAIVIALGSLVVSAFK